MPAPETATQFLISVFGGGTTESVFLCSLPNARGGSPGEKRLLTRKSEKIESFVTRWDQPGRALYFCTGTIPANAAPERRGGSPRNKSNIRETPVAWADIDYKGIIDDPVEAVSALAILMHMPSIVVTSGHGLHLYWLLREAAGPMERPRLEALLRSLADLVAGDPAVCETARLMRLPGSTNSKIPGEAIPVEILNARPERRYELADLEDMCAVMPPILTRTPTAREAANPWLAIAESFGFKPPVDVETRLAAMRHHGTGDSSLHSTQLAVSASLLNRGTPKAEVVRLLLEATAAAVGEEGKHWNWQRTMRELESMCDSWIAKSKRAREALVEQSEPETAQAANGTDNVINLADRRDKTKPKPADKPNVPRIVADGVVEHIRAQGGDILLTGGGCHLWRDGLWSPAEAADEQWLRVIIQDGFEKLALTGDVRQLNATWKRLMEHPALFERDVDWNPPGYIVTANGVLRVPDKTPEFEMPETDFQPESPKLRATRRIGAFYDPEASCPMFVTFLENLFEDQGEDATTNFVHVLQEFFGAALCVNMMHRQQRRALIIFGEANSGKSALCKVFERLMGSGVVSHAVSDLNNGKAALERFIGASAWVRDDAINEGDQIDAQKFKTLVTGEAIEIGRLYKGSIRIQVNIPILLTANALYRTTDLSDAVFSRSLLINLTRKFSSQVAAEERARLGIAQGASDLGSHIFDKEASGILNWSLRGLNRLINRGYYDIPEEAEILLRQFKDDNNPVSAWARDAIVRKPFGKVARSDLLCAYQGWQREREGDEARALGGRAFFPRLRAICPFASDTQSDDGTRYITGMALTDEALQLWKRHYDNPLKGGTRGISLSTGEVNGQWVGPAVRR